MNSLHLCGTLLIPLQLAFCQEPPGQFTAQGDVGAVKHVGSTQYDPSQQAYRISGSGTNLWFDQDEFHWAWKTMQGDFILRARVRFLGQGVDPHRKLGWMVRQNQSGHAAYVDATVHGDGLTSLQYRGEPRGNTQEIRSPIQRPDVIQLERRGNNYLMSVAKFGDPLSHPVSLTLDLGNEVHVGLFVCSHNADVKETAVFTNVRIVRPAPPDFVPYRDYLGSHIESMDVRTGHRRILHTSPKSLQAPNWTPDNRALIYNSEGLLYRLDLASGRTAVVPTGFAERNNNDHVISFNGSQLAISHHAKDHEGQSIIYTLPITGGTPQKVTPRGPSYLHSWSPDGKNLLYTAQRNGDYDVYRIPAQGGPEVQLTHSPGLDDGAEYTPDGRFIYFNSMRSGSMQIWRMHPDGSHVQPLTDDAFNNWFPHIAPDGKKVVFLSYQSDVAPDDHPFYRQVTLRMMPVTGGTPQVIAYLYGGQGTLNVPSWSPDSKSIAFVSNTLIEETP